jgi:hypothetical protein
MATLKPFANWLFAPLQGDHSPGRVIAWWEIRRVPFNVIIGGYGAVCFGIFFWAIVTSGHLQPGEDAVEPIAIMAAPVVITKLIPANGLGRCRAFIRTVTDADQARDRDRSRRDRGRVRPRHSPRPHCRS